MNDTPRTALHHARSEPRNPAGPIPSAKALGLKTDRARDDELVSAAPGPIYAYRNPRHVATLTGTNNCQARFLNRDVVVDSLQAFSYTASRSAQRGVPIQTLLDLLKNQFVRSPASLGKSGVLAFGRHVRSESRNDGPTELRPTSASELLKSNRAAPCSKG